MLAAVTKTLRISANVCGSLTVHVCDGLASGTNCAARLIEPEHYQPPLHREERALKDLSEAIKCSIMEATLLLIGCWIYLSGPTKPQVGWKMQSWMLKLEIQGKKTLRPLTTPSSPPARILCSLLTPLTSSKVPFYEGGSRPCPLGSRLTSYFQLSVSMEENIVRFSE